MLAQLCIFLVLLAKVMLASDDDNYGFGVALLVVSLAPAAIVAGSVVAIIAREIGSGMQGELEEEPTEATPQEEQLAPGCRFDHPERGAGEVIRRAEDGTLVVRFDTGAVHRYRPESQYKLRRLDRPPAGTTAPPQPSLGPRACPSLDAGRRLSDQPSAGKLDRSLSGNIDAWKCAGGGPEVIVDAGAGRRRPDAPPRRDNGKQRCTFAERRTMAGGGGAVTT